jgi:HSP20 family protein
MEVLTMFRQPLFTDPFGLQQTVDRLVNETLGSDQWQTLWSRGTSPGAGAQMMPLDVFDTGEQVVLIAAVPGMQPDQLDLTIHQNTVTLSGTIPTVTGADEAKGATWYLNELWSGEVRRSVTLPFPVDADAAQATFEHGILRVVLPKAQSAKTRKIQISAPTGQTAIAAESSPQADGAS